MQPKINMPFESSLGDDFLSLFANNNNLLGDKTDNNFNDEYNFLIFFFFC